MSHDAHHTHGSDMKAAFMGLVFGAIALLVVVITIVKLTNNHYANEKPAAEAHK